MFEEKRVDDSLYRLQLANDVWRVLYLKGDFEDFSFSSMNIARDRAENDLKKITELTGICVFIGGERLTSCRGEELGEHLITTKKLLVVDGVPQKVTLSLYRRLSNTDA
jgi:hypothetical protein